MNKLKYYITGRDSVIAIVYESDKFGRTLVVKSNPEIDEKLSVLDADYKKISDGVLLDFLYSMLPSDNT